MGLGAWLRWGMSPVDGIVAVAAAALREPGVDLAATLHVIEAVAVAGLAAIGSVAVVLVAAGLLAGAVLGRLGPVRPEVARGLEIGAVPQRLRVAIGGAATIAIVLSFELQRRVAGAARAADASAEGLTALWSGGATATLFAVGIAMIAVGAMEAWQVRRDQIVAITPTPEQAADEARRAHARRV